MMRTGLAIALVLLLPSVAAAAVELTVITQKGEVAFTAEDAWSVIGTQTKPPVAVVAFQIKDPADEGTPDSTNLAINLYDPGTPQGRDAIKKIGRKYGADQPKVSRVGDWQVFDQESTQNGSAYTILDARRDVADVTVSVRLAWPHLKGHSNDHESAMRALFARVLASVHGHTGFNEAKPGEVIRRPVRPNPALNPAGLRPAG
jgi:hypothetical protein